MPRRENTTPTTQPTIVQFQRAGVVQTFGEDELPAAIAINPVHVSAVFESNEPGVTIVRMADGRGFKVVGNYPAVVNALYGAGFEPSVPRQIEDNSAAAH